MPGTPRWGELHLRFASGARDAVSSPNQDGKSLLKLDRDSYLNFGWQRYVNLLYQSYRNNFEFLQKAFQSMVRIGTATVSSPGLILAVDLPDDYGIALSMDKSDISCITRLSQEDFNVVKNLKMKNKIPSSMNQYFCPEKNFIRLLPSSLAAGVYDLVYIINPFTITYSDTVGDDIPLDSSNDNSILGFALSMYYFDKQEFAAATKYEDTAYISAPYPLIRGAKNA